MRRADTKQAKTNNAVRNGSRKKLKLPKEQIVVVNLSGRGDKDVTEVMRLMTAQ